MAQQKVPSLQERCAVLPLHDSPGYSELTNRTKISNAERTERGAGTLLEEKKRAVHEATTQVRKHGEWYETTVRDLLRQKADDKARLGLAGLLAELTDTHGLGWSELARLVGVSIPAVRKWRLGGDISVPRLQSLSRLSAFLDMLHAEGIQDAAAWMNLPFNDDPSGLTKAQIYVAGNVVELILYAKRSLSQQELLARADVIPPSSSSRNMIVMADDGNLSIVPKI